MTSTINCVTKTFSSMSPSVFVPNVLAGAKVLATLAWVLHTAVCRNVPIRSAPYSVRAQLNDVTFY